jgi:hypothetical protein
MFDDTTLNPENLGVRGDNLLTSFRNNEICITLERDPITCKKVFPETADVMGRAIANTLAHETAHFFWLGSYASH